MHSANNILTDSKVQCTCHVVLIFV